MSNSQIRQLERAEAMLRSGDAAGAQAVCERVLRNAPRNPDAHFLLGIALLSQARPGDALSRFEATLSVDPRHGPALEHLGVAHLMLGRFQEAEQALRRAAGLAGAPASVFMRLGVAILEQRRAEEALTPLRRALALNPQDPDCHLNLGRALAATGDAASATECFHAARRIGPERSDGAFNLGVMAMQRDDLAEARQWFEQALAISPDAVDARLNLGIVLQRQSELERAAQQLNQARALAPNHPGVLSELARTLALQGQLVAAHQHYQEALAAAPAFAAALEGLASVCLASGRTREAIEHLRTTLRVEPTNVPAAAALAGALFEVGDLEDARATALRLIELDPSNAACYSTLANIHLVRGELADAIALLESGYAKTEASELLGLLTYQLRQACDWEKWRLAWDKMVPLLNDAVPLGGPFWLLCEPTTAAQQLSYTRRWASARFERLRPLPPQASGAPRDRLRIGYLSSDLHEHATAYLIAEVFERHDRTRFEVFAYAHGPDDGSTMRRRLERACEHFIDIAREPDDAAAQRIHADHLDVLVDLKGYTMGDRLTIMARRPCAIQATWLGYPGTTGADFIDYLIADPVVVPDVSEQHYSERIVRLPHCYQPNDRARAFAEPLSRRDYGLPAHGFVFCCFNQTYKITPEIFAAWMRLLQRVPESVLWVLESNPLAGQHLLRTAQAHGVAPQRLVFAPRLPNAQHLARYRVADLALDTFPYTSHTTMSDALWCGCAALALCGETFASRVSTSLLMAAGMADLVAHTLADYERLALELAARPDRLEAIRARIAHARDHSSLFDSAGFTRNLENLYLDLVKRARST